MFLQTPLHLEHNGRLREEPRKERGRGEKILDDHIEGISELPYVSRGLERIGENALRETSALGPDEEVPYPITLTAPCTGVFQAEEGNIVPVREPPVDLVCPDTGSPEPKGASGR